MPVAPQEIDRHVGAKLRALRDLRKLSQQRLADKTMIPVQQIQRYERGARRVPASALWVICRVLRASPTDLFDGLGGGMTEEVIRISRRVADTACLLNQIQGDDARLYTMELIRLCERAGATAQ